MKIIYPDIDYRYDKIYIREKNNVAASNITIRTRQNKILKL